jgi:hypothetical protein
MIPRLGTDRGNHVDHLAVPEDGRYAIPIKGLVRDAESLQVGDLLTIDLEVDP